MRLNYETVLVGRRVVLVPYRPEHVPRYHAWMQDPHLLHMTGSEPMSMDEEMEMQKEWRDDDAKCTFIVLDREACEEGLPPAAAVAAAKMDTDATRGDDGENDTEIEICQSADVAPDFVEKNLHAMVGDVNLFLSEEEPDTDDDEEGVYSTCVAGSIASNSSAVPVLASGQSDQSSSASAADGPTSASPIQVGLHVHIQAELDIMIAEESARGRGMGSEASRIMLWYGSHNLMIRRFFAKIKNENDASKGLFEQRLGFVEINYVECFGEHEYERKEEHCENMAKKLKKELGFEIVGCNCKLIE
mmetsp:Transcript_22067/g.63270  ORF Transcript_22067/g.63270 Transcript_22067/m.63270 type:complete len:303 (-) Transcript_22067:435-1343(-)